MLQTMFFVVMAQVLNYTHSPLSCALIFSFISSVALFALQVPAIEVGAVFVIRAIGGYAFYKMMEERGDSIWVWWLLLITGGVFLFFAENYILAALNLNSF